ncbi:DUF805 domain-containing protein [Kribbella sp. CA-293567]|uniref:DUF805 domain-containing protein n=1 Tax=Kribbella sp. CA-293567 TaxID=3002436 RepID=UPI0022DE4C4C|nr:DUF805 domain-containing protein [Kribbella sp. CA-293567]WBQ02291.1 DUF805 domain-containing protein [Kribbella sp. CA-293567]
MQWFTDVIKKYAVFSGRARRKEFWMFVLFSTIISIIIGIVDRLLGLNYGANDSNGVLGTIYTLAILLPSIGVAIRRMHDTGRSGWWVLINLVPCVGFIVFIVFAAQEGNAGDNQYGPDPKAAERFGPGGYPGYPPAPQA